jgi:hypothetical protein
MPSLWQLEQPSKLNGVQSLGLATVRQPHLRRMRDRMASPVSPVAAFVSIVLGCVMWAVALALTWPALHKQGLSNFIDDLIQNQSRERDEVILMFAVFVLLALWPFLYGVAVLRGRAGKPMILGKVCATPDTVEKSEAGSSSRTDRTDGVCVGCQRPIPPGSAYCPHCGARQIS